ncbi:MAG: histidine--tRNA ligase [Bacteroidales bacterium]|jgi:histidyl-tRNA synthetase|nr:histidine--tRNA ligase [Bacteroidales bacterium]
MSKQKTGNPRGTRDFLPHEMIRRNYLFHIIRTTFEHFGYLPIETPAMENISTLTGKYGEEGDRLLFKVLNSGNFMEGIDILNLTVNQLSLAICEKGLRYDLTVPFARFVVQHQQELTLPFKRYQIQPVWRADRPQKGRYREFYQCDADVIGSNSLLNEVELIMLMDTIFSKLNMEVCIKINNRKILSGIAQITGCENAIIDITVAIDKMEKIGLEKVKEELLSKNIPETAILQLQPLLLMKGNHVEKLNQLKKILQTSETGMKGIEELETVFDYISQKDLVSHAQIELDLTLARGLNYYTGTIFEVKSLQVETGSITGGGRYDDLTGIFGLPNMSGVGISFGVERIYDVWSELNKTQTDVAEQSIRALFINFGKQEEIYCLKTLKQLRKNNICAELFPDNAKLQKQMKYADAKKIPYVVLAGENEMKLQKFTLKNMQTGLQQTLDYEELLNILSK